MSQHVGIIGGGISGLTTAFLLKRKGLDVTVFERSDTLGGNIQTITRDGYTIEQGPNSLLRSPKLIELIKLLNLENEVLPADAAAKTRYILSGGKLEAMGPKSFVNGYFSLKTILGLISEPFVFSKSPGHESVAEFVSRRIGPEFLDKAIDPFVSGVYAGDPADLSMRSAFPKLYEMERDYGSLIMGSLRRRKDKTDPDFPRTFSFKKGLKTWIDALTAELGNSIKLSTAVESIETADHRGFAINGEAFDAVVISTPSYVAADLIKSFDADLSQTLREVNYPQLAVVILGFASDQIKTKLDGFGFLVASKENRKILGTLFHSAVFPERAPEGHQLLVTFVGGVRSGHTLDARTDEDLKATVLSELGDILGVSGEPDFVHIKRWNKAIPQYRVGYEEVTKACSEFETANPGMYFCSNFYRGVSMGDCVKNAFQTAGSIGEYLKVRPQK
jgi:protoporphyrinogen/coproporphyrinogen III oxidase